MSRIRGLAVLLAGIGLVLTAGCADEPDPQTERLRENGNTTAEASGDTGRLLEATSSDGHRLRQIPADGAPSVRLDVAEDSAGGWNLHLVTERFRFTPQRSGEEARAGEGHAHLYLDGEKIARIYGPWYHLDGAAVPPGEHTLTVSLNANDHTVWAVDGKEIADQASVTGGQDGDGHGHDHGDGHEHGTGPGSEGETGSDQDGQGEVGPDTKADVRAVIRIAGGEVTSAPDRIEADKGDVVRIEVHSDAPDTVHLHWYDLEAPVRPGEPAVITFTAGQTGRFEVESHDSGLLLTQLLVR